MATYDFIVADKKMVDLACQEAARWMTDQIRGHHSAGYSMTNPVALVMMTGGLFFGARVLQLVKEDITVDYIHCTRYGRGKEGGTVRWERHPQCTPIQHRNVFILDDVFDEGITLTKAVQECYAQGADFIKTVVLCTKEGVERAPDIRTPDFAPLGLPNKWLYGMGMDNRGIDRNLPEIWIEEQHNGER